MNLALPSRNDFVSQKSELKLTIPEVVTENSAEHPCSDTSGSGFLDDAQGVGYVPNGSNAPQTLPKGSGTVRQCSESLEKLIQRHRPLVKKLCAGYARQHEDAEDLEAMTVMTACRRFGSYDPARGAFGTWLGAILRNEAADMRRRAARQPLCLPNDEETERLLESTAATFVEPVPDGPCAGEFELTPLLKRAFELVKLEGMTCAEAGRAMGKTEGTIRTYVWKARQVMRRAVS
jgi:DNA-directed RNA polymerase specialized sigma24 family protein